MNSAKAKAGLAGQLYENSPDEPKRRLVSTSFCLELTHSSLERETVVAVIITNEIQSLDVKR
jgi:hypothetical protein